MAKMMKMDVGGTIRDVIEVPFEIVKEPWAEYEMLDGGRLRVRHILQRLFVVCDEEGKPATDEAGDPIVVVRAMPVSVVATR
jgi:hypothetical protein